MCKRRILLFIWLVECHSCLASLVSIRIPAMQSSTPPVVGNVAQWFGAMPNKSHHRTKARSLVQPPLPPVATQRVTLTTLPHVVKAQTRTTPMQTSRTNEPAKGTRGTMTPIRRFHLPAFGDRRQATHPLCGAWDSFDGSPATFSEPSIPTRGRFDKELHIDYARKSSERATKATSRSRTNRTAAMPTSLSNNGDFSAVSEIYLDRRPPVASNHAFGIFPEGSIARSQMRKKTSLPLPRTDQHQRTSIPVKKPVNRRSQPKMPSVRQLYRSYHALGALQDPQTNVDGRNPVSSLATSVYESLDYMQTAANQAYLSDPNERSPGQQTHRATSIDSFEEMPEDSGHGTFARAHEDDKQLKKNPEGGLRLLVDHCIRPAFDGHVRAPHPPDHLKQNQNGREIESLPDKLVSSVDYSRYARHQR